MGFEGRFNGQTPPPERERTDRRQEVVDELFTTLAPYREKKDEAFNDALYERQGSAMDELLSDEVSAWRGEEYDVRREEDFFYLADRKKKEYRGFDRMDQLGVFAEVQEDLRTGNVRISYDVKAKSKDQEGLNKRSFDEALLNDARIDLKASPEALKHVHQKLESEYAQEVAEFERKSVAFTRLADWVRGRQGKRIGEKEWNEQPILGELWSWASGATCEISLQTSRTGGEEIQLVIFDGDQVRDIVAEKKPVQPERWFEHNGDSEK